MKNSLPIFFIAILLVGTLIFANEKIQNEPILEEPTNTVNYITYLLYNSFFLIIISFSFIFFINNLRKENNEKLKLLNLNSNFIKIIIYGIIFFNALTFFALLPPDLDFAVKVISWALLGALMVQVTFFKTEKKKDIFIEHEKNIKKLVTYIETSSDVNHSKYELLKNGWSEEIINEAIIKTLKLEHDAMNLIKYEKKIHHKKIDVKHELIFAGWNEKIVDSLIKKHW